MSTWPPPAETLVRDLLVGLRERGLDVTNRSSQRWTAARRCAAPVLDVFDRPVLGRC